MRINSGPHKVPVQSGRNFRVDSPPDNAVVTRELATELERVLEIFGGNARKRRIGVFFKPGIFGHHKVGRAADIYAVGGIGFEHWKADWDAALRGCAEVVNERERRARLKCATAKESWLATIQNAADLRSLVSAVRFSDPALWTMDQE